MATELEAIGGNLASALETINVPSYVVNASGVVCWSNDAAMRLLGDNRGRQYTSAVAPEERRRAQERFARHLVGTRVSDEQFTAIDSSGARILVEVSSVPLSSGHHVVGFFGQIVDVERDDVRPPHPALTPRQTEVLRLLEHGRSTQQIAAELHLSVETVRNHIRRLLRTLGVHTRLEAVALARHGRLLDDVADQVRV